MRAILWQKSISKQEKVSFGNRILDISHALEISFIVEIALIKSNLKTESQTNYSRDFALKTTLFLLSVGRLPIPIDPPYLQQVTSPKQVLLHLLLRKVPTAFSILSGLRRIDKRHTSNTRRINTTFLRYSNNNYYYYHPIIFDNWESLGKLFKIRIIYV